jgi:hypothetical protein
MTARQKRLLTIIVPVQAVLAVAAWRDLARRTDDQVLGRKKVWRALLLLNPGNSLIYWLFGRRGARTDTAEGKARRVDVPETFRAPDTLPDPSYTCAFEIDVAPADARSAEEWLRAIMEEGPAPVRWFILAGWIVALRLRLAPRPSPGHVLGWKILSASPTEIVIGVEGATLSARQVVQVEDARAVHATIVHYDRPAARVLWAVAAPIHVRVIPYLMTHAASARPVPRPAERDQAPADLSRSR